MKSWFIFIASLDMSHFEIAHTNLTLLFKNVTHTILTKIHSFVSGVSTSSLVRKVLALFSRSSGTVIFSTNEYLSEFGHRILLKKSLIFGAWFNIITELEQMNI